MLETLAKLTHSSLKRILFTCIYRALGLIIWCTKFCVLKMSQAWRMLFSTYSYQHCFVFLSISQNKNLTRAVLFRDEFAFWLTSKSSQINPVDCCITVRPLSWLFIPNQCFLNNYLPMNRSQRPYSNIFLPLPCAESLLKRAMCLRFPDYSPIHLFLKPYYMHKY